MHFSYDSLAMEEKLGVEHAKVALSITAGLFKLDAGVEVTYEKQAETLAENSYITCFVRGGEGEDVSKLITAFKQYATSPLNQSKYDALDAAREYGGTVAEIEAIEDEFMQAAGELPSYGESILVVDYTTDQLRAKVIPYAAVPGVTRLIRPDEETGSMPTEQDIADKAAEYNARVIDLR